MTAAHAALLDERLPGLLEGLHLHGSLGFGGEFFGGSDVDFVAVTSRRPSASDIDVLRRVHAELDRRWPEPAYDGFYLLEADLAGRPEDVPEGPGVLHQWFDVGTHADITHITWRELRRPRDHVVRQGSSRHRRLERRCRAAPLDPRQPRHLLADAARGDAAPPARGLAPAGGRVGWPRGAPARPPARHRRADLEVGCRAVGPGAYPQHREILEEALRVRERPDDPSTYAADPDRRRRDLIALMTEVIADGVARHRPAARRGRVTAASSAPGHGTTERPCRHGRQWSKAVVCRGS